MVSDCTRRQRRLETDVLKENGNVAKKSLANTLNGSNSSEAVSPDMDRLDCPVTCLQSITWHSTEYMVAGDTDGVVRIWKTK